MHKQKAGYIFSLCILPMLLLLSLLLFFTLNSFQQQQNAAALVLLLLPSGPSPATNTTTSSNATSNITVNANFLTYANSTLGFKIEYPSSYRIHYHIINHISSQLYEVAIVKVMIASPLFAGSCYQICRHNNGEII
jgi:hypothetical protein